MKLFEKSAPIQDASEEHHIILPGLDIAFNHSLKLVFVIDQTGGSDEYALTLLQKAVEAQGYFLHCVTVNPPTEAEVKNGNN